MKKLVLLGVIIIFLITFVGTGTVIAQGPGGKGKGFDEFGYNYKAKIFNGDFDGADRVWDGMYWGSEVDVTSAEYFDPTLGIEEDICVPVAGTHLVMKWTYEIGEAEEGDWITNLFVWDDENGHHVVFFRIENIGEGPLWGSWLITQARIGGQNQDSVFCE